LAVANRHPFTAQHHPLQLLYLTPRTRLSGVWGGRSHLNAATRIRRCDLPRGRMFLQRAQHQHSWPRWRAGGHPDFAPRIATAPRSLHPMTQLCA